MLVLVKRPLRWSPDGIAIRAGETDEILDLPHSIARGLIASGYVVLAPETKSLSPADTRRGKTPRMNRGPS